LFLHCKRRHSAFFVTDTPESPAQQQVKYTGEVTSKYLCFLTERRVTHSMADEEVGKNFYAQAS
jgi:hypothetical protein